MLQMVYHTIALSIVPELWIILYINNLLTCLYECETKSLTVREEHKLELGLFGNRLLRIILEFVTE